MAAGVGWGQARDNDSFATSINGFCQADDTPSVYQHHRHPFTLHDRLVLLYPYFVLQRSVHLFEVKVRYSLFGLF